MDEGFSGGVEGDTGYSEFRGKRTVEDDEDLVGEGGLAEGGEESTGEKGREERIPPDDREVCIFRPFLKSGGHASQYQNKNRLREIMRYLLGSR